MSAEEATDSLAVALERLRTRVDARANDVQSRELADQLERHYQSIAASIAAERLRILGLVEALDLLNGLPPISRAFVDPSSRIPGGRFVHRLIGKVISRHTEGIYQQFRLRDDLYRRVLTSVGEATIAVVRAQSPTVERRLSTIADRVSVLESERRSDR